MMLRLLMFALLACAFVVPQQTRGQERSRYFPETKYRVAGRFLEYWEANGGLATFGYPLSAAARKQNRDNRVPVLVQHFERARFELHPNNKPPFDVLLGRLSVEQLEARGVRWQTLPPTTLTGPDCRLFAKTKHQMCGRIKETWERQGLAIYGQPVSDLLLERGADGSARVVQYFERARFELHPDNKPPFDVLLGHLERERISGKMPTGRLESQPYYFFPVQPPISATYGAAHHDYPATDIFAPTGTTFVAPTSGVVEFVSREDRWDARTNRGEDRGGLAVSLVGDDGIRYYGSHLSEVAAGIKARGRVRAGQPLGLIGNTGSARPTPPHLHFGISRPTRPDDWATRRGEVSPYPFLQQWETGMPLRPTVPWLSRP